MIQSTKKTKKHANASQVLPNAGWNMAGTGRWFDAHGGQCSGRQAPYGYWCSDANPRSQLPNDYQSPYNMPGGFTYTPAVLQDNAVDAHVNASAAPPDVARAATWKHPRGAIYHMRSNFYSVQCLVDSVDTATHTVHFNHSVGCDQGGPDPAGFPYWYVENVLEECDDPGEYFYDQPGQALYYTFNGTERPTGEEVLALTSTKVMFNVTGTMADPVRDVTIRGLTISDAAYTFLGTRLGLFNLAPMGVEFDLARSSARTPHVGPQYVQMS